MIKREAKFSTKFKKWAKYNWDAENKPAYFEYKATVDDSIPFSCVSEKEYFNLQLKKFYIKFSDFSRMGTPLDAIMFCGVGYIVVNYNYPSKTFYIIRVDNWIKERDNSERKSLTEDRANVIGERHELGKIE